MKMEVVVQGFPGKTASGSLSWSSVIYIESGDEKILFDTGGPSKRNPIRSHLQKIGVNANEITMLVFSHFHDDHVRNYDYFPNARIIMHAKEAEWIQTEPSDFAVPQFLYPAVQKTGRLELVTEDGEIAPGVETLLVPGHTPGSMALVLRDSDMPVTVLTGDAVKNIAELATGKVAKALDPALNAQSIKKIRDIAEIVVPGHDRMLKVTEDKIIALTAAHETIILPAGVANADSPRYLELVIEQSWLQKEDIL